MKKGRLPSTKLSTYSAQFQTGFLDLLLDNLHNVCSSCAVVLGRVPEFKLKLVVGSVSQTGEQFNGHIQVTYAVLVQERLGGVGISGRYHVVRWDIAPFGCSVNDRFAINCGGNCLP
jgi:alpha-D-ribose 1-methylphosphonate 5-triphosphate synthase subunit PhnG